MGEGRASIGLGLWTKGQVAKTDSAAVMAFRLEIAAKLRYGKAMRLRIAALAASVVATPALAMNWEGHDEGWMQDLEAGLAYEQALPHALPLPGSDCPVTPAEAAANPYDQIPLARHKCPAADEAGTEP